VGVDMTGAIADAFNQMIGELRRIIGDAQGAAIRVAMSAQQLQLATGQLAAGSEAQASQIVDTSAAVEEMAASINQVSENAAASATVAEQARANAEQGTRAVTRTIEGMGAIRDQVQETAKRIKRLGESSQEIGEIVQLIGDIADRTSILALNASIQAAMAGEAGRGFAVVAEEVERLADRATDATKRISTLIKTTQSETAEAVVAMEDTTREVVKGSALANEAGLALSEIQNVSNRLAHLIQSISDASHQQAKGSEQVSKAMHEISSHTRDTASGTKKAADSIGSLATLANGLNQSMVRFKLPTHQSREKAA
jgi:twitching motility protein PilJ